MFVEKEDFVIWLIMERLDRLLGADLKLKKAGFYLPSLFRYSFFFF
jgi:hypothetical protein